MTRYNFGDEKGVKNLWNALSVDEVLKKFLRLFMDEHFALKQKVEELEGQIEVLSRQADPAAGESHTFG